MNVVVVVGFCWWFQNKVWININFQLVNNVHMTLYKGVSEFQQCSWAIKIVSLSDPDEIRLSRYKNQIWICIKKIQSFCCKTRPSLLWKMHVNIYQTCLLSTNFDLLSNSEKFCFTPRLCICICSVNQLKALHWFHATYFYSVFVSYSINTFRLSDYSNLLVCISE